MSKTTPRTKLEDTNFNLFFDRCCMYEKSEDKPYTNSRITGGSYHIPDDKYDKFIDLHYAQNILGGRLDSITEFQHLAKGPILVDLDFRFPYSINTRQYEKDHLDDLVFTYLNLLKKMYAFDSKSKFSIYVMEKPNCRQMKDDDCTKDGIHLIIGINAERKMQVILRKKVMDELSKIWEDMPFKNTWEDILDKGIVHGTTAWQLYGCAKPNCDPYKLTYVYEIDGLDTRDMNFSINCQPASKIDLKSIIHKMSARYTHHPEFKYTPSFAKTMEDTNFDIKKKSTSFTNLQNLSHSAQTTPRINASTLSFTNEDVARAMNQEELDGYVQTFIETIDKHDYKLIELYQMTMALPATYYESGAYSKWVRVGWALKRTDARLFVVWAKFSSQMKTFSYTSDLPDLYDRWNKFSDENVAGLTERSIVYWVKEENPEKYREIMANSVSYKLEETLGLAEQFDPELDKIDRRGSGDYDIACVLHALFKHDYICVGVKNNVWFKYVEPCWRECDSGTELRQAISNELRAYYLKYCRKISGISSSLDPNNPEHAVLIPKYKGYIDKILKITSRLSNTNDKKNIMIEAKEWFFDKEYRFLNNLDANRYLLCFRNGVVDFAKKEFRKGRPEDYISMCTNINYIGKEERSEEFVAEIRKFMSELFPGDPALEKYMWQHLASTLIGALPDQTFNMYIGEGQNGKSLLVSLMTLVLGEYKQDLPLSILIDKQQKIGAVSPELACLKGARYVVGNEPDKGEVINAGRMKALTSGLDMISARVPYSSKMLNYYPQFKMALCTNELMTIHSTDHGTWRRIRIVPFRSKFCDNPVSNDPDHPYQFKINRELEKRINDWKEVFASMLVDIAYETGGKVDDCPTVLEASGKYRQSQDYIAAFMDDMLVEGPGESIKQSELSNIFEEWYRNTQGGGVPKVKDLYLYIEKRFKKDGKTRKYTGIGKRQLVDDRNDQFEDDEVIE